jgi:multidrug efflux pump subunit AcrA (membrane-fusion protein)
MHKTLIVAVVIAALVQAGPVAAREPVFEDIFVVKESLEAPTVVVSGNVVPFRQVTLAAQLPGRVKFIAGIEGESFERARP